MGSWLLRYSPHLVGADALAESKMISAKEKQRQLGEAVASGQWLVISENLHVLWKNIRKYLQRLLNS
jgi:hypothetical protein